MYLLYGAGKVCQSFITKLKNKGIGDFHIVDSDCNLHGKEIDGVEIENLDDLDINEFEAVIITTDVQYYGEITERIRRKSKVIEIIYSNDVFIFSDADHLNLGSIELREKSTGIYSSSSIKKIFENSSLNDLDKFIYLYKHNTVNKVIHYTEAYDRFFSKYRYSGVKVVEIGVSKGGSLQMWKHYFGNKSEIIGIDIAPECKMYEEEGISVYIGDQSDQKFLHNLKDRIGLVDVIIDDGSHKMKDQITSFEILFDLLNDNGVYLCEDIHTSYWNEYGGGYRKQGTFMEYAKWLCDGLNEQYFESDSINFPYRGKIKSISFYDGMIFIEKKKYANISPILTIGGDGDA